MNNNLYFRNIISIIKRLFPRYFKDRIKRCIKFYRERKYIKDIPLKQKLALSKLKNKPVIKCVFFVSELADWKCDYVYRLMQKEPRFDPIIIICPVSIYGEDMMIKEQNRLVDYCKLNDYKYRLAYNVNSKKYINVREEENPDVIFYTTPYVDQIGYRFHITNYMDILGVYIPYAFNNNSDLCSWHNFLINNLAWRYYVESEEHLYFSKLVARNGGRNCVVSGYPAIEGLIDKHKPSDDSWKIKDRKFKRVIWAPHHTIAPEGNVIYSCFLEYADFMVRLANKYNNSVQFVFKPHPLLREKLEKYWGKNETDYYYNCWQNMPNTSLIEGDYVDIFLTSDAMIHDSGSFIAEYLFVNKPVLRTLNDIPLEKLYNSFVLRCLDQYYFARNSQEVELFIQNLINGIDPLKDQRSAFVNEVLMPKCLPSQNIINDILDSIDNQILYRN